MHWRRSAIAAHVACAQVLTLANSDNYLHRMTVLSAIGALAGGVHKDVVHNSMLPAVVACSKVGLGRVLLPPCLASLERRAPSVAAPLRLTLAAAGRRRTACPT